MTKKVPKKILRIERNFFVNLRKKYFGPSTPRRRRRRQFFWTGGATPPTEIYRRAAADTMTSAHSSILIIPLPISTTPTLAATLSPPGTLEIEPELLLTPFGNPLSFVVALVNKLVTWCA